jgi:hypothetical protein
MGRDPWNVKVPRYDPRKPMPHVDLGAVLKEAVRSAARRWPGATQAVLDAIDPPPVALASLGTPRTPADAPRAIQVPAAMQIQFKVLRQVQLSEAQLGFGAGGSLQGRERGTTLVVDKRTGELASINDVVSDSGRSVDPNLSIDAARYDLVGTFHTHVNLDRKTTTPMDPDDPNAAFSGGDIRYQLEQGFPVSVLQGSTGQFMLVRTDATQPITIQQGQALKDEYNRELNAAMGGGNRRLETYEDATLRLTKELAAKHNLALYEGKGGTFTRTVPP